MSILIGRILCGFAKVIGNTNLYAASRHSFRSGRPESFGLYWRFYNSRRQ
jgi:hypothetical protein